MEKQIYEVQDYCAGRIDAKFLHRPGATFLHALQYRNGPSEVFFLNPSLCSPCRQ